jgi:hypothetical protein
MMTTSRTPPLHRQALNSEGLPSQARIGLGSTTAPKHGELNELHAVRRTIFRESEERNDY